MKKNRTHVFGALTAVAFSSVSVFASGTDTWLGNAGLNWNTAANWSAGSGGSAPPASGDSLVLGAAGTAGLTLNNNLSGLSLNGVSFNGPGAFTLSGNALALAGGLTNSSGVGETISLVLGGAGSVANVFGALTLNGSAVNTYAGPTIVSGGAFIEDFANLASATDLINNGSTLVLGGGTFQVKQRSATPTSQTFNGTTINADSTTALIGTQVTSGALTINLGALTHNTGGTVNFTVPAGGNIKTATGNDATGILGGWATAGTTDWAANDGSGNITTYGGYTSVSGAVTGAGASGQNWKTSANTTLSASATINSLSQQNDFTLNSGVTLTLGSGGLILGSTERWFIGSSGTLKSGLSSGELYIHANTINHASGWQLQPVVADGSVATALIKDGPGQVQMQNGNNTYSGGSYLNAGAVWLGAGSTGSGSSVTKGPLGTGPVTLNGGTLTLNAQTLGNNLVAPANTVSIIDNSGNNGTLNGSLTGSGIVTIQNSSGNNLSDFINGDWSGFTGTLNYYVASKVVNLFTPAGGVFDLSHVTLNVTNTPNINNSSFRGASGQTVELGALAGPSGYLDAAGTFAIGYLNTSTTYGGLLRNNGSTGNLVKVGTGALALSGASSYTGTTTVENGSLIAGAAVASAANSPFGNASSAIALGDDNSINNNYSPSLLIGGAFTMARQITVGSSGNSTTGIYTLGGNTPNSATFSGNITLNQNLVVTQATGGILTISGAIGSGSYTLTKVGGGTAILSGANSYSGLTIVSNGMLMVGNTTQGNGAVTAVDGAGVGVVAAADATYWSPSSLTIGSAVGGTLRFGVYGPNNTLLVPASLTLNGTTTINISSAPMANNVSYPLFSGYTSGALTLGSQPGGLFGQLTVSGGTVFYQVTNVAPDVWTAKVSTNWDATTANWTNAIGGNLFVTGNPVQFDDTANGTSPLLVNIAPAAVSPATIIVNNTAKSYVVGGSAISGGTGLTKTGNNTLTLTSTNTFTGAIMVSGGTVEIGGAGQLGGGNYSADIDDETTLKYNSTAAQTLSGVISGNGVLIVGTNNGGLTLSGGNSYGGGTTISNGTVMVGNNSALGTGTVTLSGGTLLGGGGGYTLGNTIQAQAGTTSTIDCSGNLTLNGNLTGGGIINRGAIAISSLFLAGDNSGFTGTYQDQNNQASITRWNTPDSGSAAARWIFNQAQIASRTTLNFGSGTIQFGSISGAGYISQNSAGTATMEVGALGLNDTFAGSIQNNSGVIALTKVGSGTLTLSGANNFTGGVNLNAGVLSVSNAAALSSSGTISFGGGTLQYTAANQTDYSPRIAGSIAPISIDLNGTNVTFATALPASNTGGLVLTNSTGVGVLTLTANNTFTSNTVINAGTLALSGSGNLSASTNISVASGATFDVSGVSYTLGSSQTLSGSGTVTGAVTTAGAGSAIQPGGAGTAGVLTFQNHLNLGSGASAVFDISSSHLSGNDQVAVAGNLALSSADTIHINALGGTANLDQTGDYVLFNVAGTTTMASQPVLVFDNAAPGNYSHYAIKTSGNNVVLRYSASSAPVIVSVVVTNTVDGSTVGTRGRSVTVYVVVQPGVGTVTNVSANLSALGGSGSQTLTPLGGNNYSYTLPIGPGATVGMDTVGVTATDTTPLSGSGSATFTVNVTTETWSGMAADDNWGSGANWASTLPPGYVGDTLIFTGSTRTTPNLEANYNVAGLTFDGSASGFTLGSATGNTLTLSGPLNNSSGNAQVLNMAVIMNGTQIISDSGAGLALAGAISGSGIEVSSGTVILAGTNTSLGDTTVDAGATVKLGGGAALPSGNGAGNVSVSGTLDLNGTNASINGLSGSGTVGNSGANPVTLAVGLGDRTGTFAGTIQNLSGALALVKTGTNVLELDGANTFTGGVTISNGIVVVGNASALGTGTNILAGGTLKSGAAVTINNPVEALTNTSSVLDTAPNNGNLTLSGNLTGGGTITRGTPALPQSLYLAGDNSGFTGIFQDQNSGNCVTRFAAATAGSASARWIFNQAQIPLRTTLDFASGTIEFGSISGAGYLVGNSAGAKTVQVGALGLNDTFAGSLQDGAGVLTLTKVGGGTLVLSGADTYTGPTIVSNGTLVVSSAKTSAGDFTVADGATLGVNLASAGAMVNMTSLTLGNCTNNFSGISSATVPAITNSGALTLSGTVTVNVSGVLFVGQYPLIASASISGTGGFVLGRLPLGAVASLATNGNTIVLNVTAGSAPGYVWTGLNTASWDLTTANNWSSNGLAIVYADGQIVQFDDSSARTNVVLAANVAPVSLIVTNTTRNYTFASVGGAAIAGSGSLTKQGSGTLTIANTNSYSSGTVINNGTLQLGDGVANNGVVAGGITDNGRLIFANPFVQTFSGIISGTGTVVKNGSGALTLALSNSYSGGTMVSGPLIMPNGAVNAFGSGTLAISNVTLIVQAGSGGAYNSANSDYIGNNVFVPAGTINVIDDSQNYYGNLWVGNDTNQWTGSGTVKFQNNSGVQLPAMLWNGNPLQNFDGTISLGSASNSANQVLCIFGQDGGGAFTQVNTFDASGTAWALGDVGYSLVQCANACTAVKLGSISSVNANTVIRGNVTSATTYEVGALNTSSTYAGTIVDWGTAVALTKVGAGTLTLSGANTYTGLTMVSNGALLVSGSIASAVTVNGGALAGTGAVGGAVTVNASGTLSPGAATIGTLTLNNNLTLTGNTLIKLQKGLAQSNDVVAVAGALVYGGKLTVTNLGSALAAGDTFRIFKSGGSGSLTVRGNAGSGLAFSFADGLLSVVSSGPSGPGVITNSISGNVLHLSWQAGQGWRLVAQTNNLSNGLSATGWGAVSGAADGSYSITTDPAKPSVFYELVNP